ncbi:DUF6017 domain-containing protein [uncultured Neglectibacter sp.]|uniref:DUF6017 domain-containing protein n=1 Tax=uncultured Neglectibacter sp. TaxID=1924108 RepID=UPI0034DF4839
MSNHILRDKRLSMKARGLLAYVLSLPDDWDYTVAGLSAAAGMGKAAVNSGLHEMEAVGYLTRRMLRAEDGTFLDIEYTFHEAPLLADQEAAVEEQKKQKVQKSKENTGLSPFSDFRLTDNRQTVLYKDKEKQSTKRTKNLSIHPAEIKTQIGFDFLAAEYGAERIEAIIDLISEVYSMTGKTVNVGKTPFPVSAVQERFSKLEREHIEYVLDSLDRQQNPIRNPKGYLLASLYNAPTTMIEQWRNRANVDSG